MESCYRGRNSKWPRTFVTSVSRLLGRGWRVAEPCISTHRPLPKFVLWRSTRASSAKVLGGGLSRTWSGKRWIATYMQFLHSHIRRNSFENLDLLKLSAEYCL